MKVLGWIVLILGLLGCILAGVMAVEGLSETESYRSDCGRDCRSGCTVRRN
jgi:hypothetical protein